MWVWLIITCMYIYFSNESIHVPVDKLLFLESRITTDAVQPQVGTLVSSERGYAKFWSFPKNIKLRGTACTCIQAWTIQTTDICISGSFCLTSNGEERNVLALSTDDNDHYLIAGDVRGCIAIFDISQYCIGFTVRNHVCIYLDVNIHYMVEW